MIIPITISIHKLLIHMVIFLISHVEFVAPDTEQIDIYDIAVIMNNALENAFEGEICKP